MIIIIFDQTQQENYALFYPIKLFFYFRNETSETIQYTGPDVLNYKKITLDNLKNVNPNSLKTVILDSQKKDNIYFNYLIKEADEKRSKKAITQNQSLLKDLTLDQAEVDKINKIISQLMLSTSGSYFSQAAAPSNLSAIKQEQNEQISMKNETEQQNSAAQNNDNEQSMGEEAQNELTGDVRDEDNDKSFQQNEDTIDISEVPKAHISYFPKVAFALLKGRTWQFYMQKLQIIIGRSLINLQNQKKTSLNWHIDLEVGASKKVSRQHAVILFNFEKRRFEIKCLSKKFNIKVDNNLYSNKDDAVPLKNKSLITVGNEHFYFFLPKNLVDETQKKLDQNQLDEAADQNIREDDEDFDKNRVRAEGDEDDEEMDEDDMDVEGDEEDEGYRQRRNMRMDGDDIDDEGESLNDIENKSSKRKKLKRNEDGYEQMDESDYQQNSEEEDGNNDFLDDEEKEFLKKTNKNVNENQDDEDDDEEQDEDENENEDDDEENDEENDDENDDENEDENESEDE